MIKVIGIWNTRDRHSTTKKHLLDKSGMKATAENAVYLLEKKYATHPTAQPDSSLMKVRWVIKRDGRAIGLALISYRIENGCVLPALPHGNKKSFGEVYQRTLPSALQYMKKKCFESADSSNISGELKVGCINLTADYRQFIPRNVHQLYNLRRSCKQYQDSTNRKKPNIKQIYQHLHHTNLQYLDRNESHVCTTSRDSYCLRVTE